MEPWIWDKLLNSSFLVLSLSGTGLLGAFWCPRQGDFLCVSECVCLSQCLCWFILHTLSGLCARNERHFMYYKAWLDTKNISVKHTATFLPVRVRSSHSHWKNPTLQWWNSACFLYFHSWFLHEQTRGRSTALATATNQVLLTLGPFTELWQNTKYTPRLI